VAALLAADVFVLEVRVARVGATVTSLQLLTTNAAGQLVPAQPGQPVVAVALEPQTYVSPGSFANVFVLGLFGSPLAQTLCTPPCISSARAIAGRWAKARALSGRTRPRGA